MKHIGTMIAALLVGGAMSPDGAQAQTRGGFEVGAELFDYAYRERLEGATIVYDDGVFGGFHLNYVETIGGGLFLRGKLSAAGGSVDYRRPDPAGEARLENVSQATGQLELQLGFDLAVGGGATLSPFTGLASRALIDESGGKVTSIGEAGYDREIGYSYIPVGVGARVPVGSGGAILLSAQYNWVVNGTAESKFSGLDPELPDLKLDLDGGHGFEASAAYQVALGKRALSIGPFVRHWRLDRSDSFVITNPDDPSQSLEFFEPANRTTELGLRLSFVF
ncbi:MAG TPA: hypothetical protein VEZ70_08445 [Allosphingosinicella sp.]|nr:hypothetical protein [Allosphingosinicella sp.]